MNTVIPMIAQLTVLREFQASMQGGESLAVPGRPQQTALGQNSENLGGTR